MLSQVIEETMLKTEIDCGQPVFDESVKDITAFQGVRHFGETKCGRKDKFWSKVFAKKGGECVMPCSFPVENYCAQPSYNAACQIPCQIPSQYPCQPDNQSPPCPINYEQPMYQQPQCQVPIYSTRNSRLMSNTSHFKGAHDQYGAYLAQKLIQSRNASCYPSAFASGNRSRIPSYGAYSGCGMQAAQMQVPHMQAAQMQGYSNECYQGENAYSCQTNLNHQPSMNCGMEYGVVEPNCLECGGFVDETEEVEQAPCANKLEIEAVKPCEIPTRVESLPCEIPTEQSCEIIVPEKCTKASESEEKSCNLSVLI